MPLKKATGNMYSWITHTWNAIRGKCGFNCSYCFVGRWQCTCESGKVGK
jgi:hypothetical protein